MMEKGDDETAAMKAMKAAMTVASSEVCRCALVASGSSRALCVLHPDPCELCLGMG